MSEITKAQSRALANVCRLVVAAWRLGQPSVDVAELAAALDPVDVEGLADPRPCNPVRNVGQGFDVSSVGCG